MCDFGVWLRALLGVNNISIPCRLSCELCVSGVYVKTNGRKTSWEKLSRRSLSLVSPYSSSFDPGIVSQFCVQGCADCVLTLQPHTSVWAIRCVWLRVWVCELCGLVSGLDWELVCVRLCMCDVTSAIRRNPGQKCMCSDWCICVRFGQTTHFYLGYLD